MDASRKSTFGVIGWRFFWRKAFGIVIFSMLVIGVLTAQRGRTDGSFGSELPEGVEQDSLTQADFLEEQDTFGVYYFHPSTPTEIETFQDTFINDFHQFNPTRTNRLDYANLGVLGSAHQELIFSPVFRRGFDVGLHQFDLYYIQPDEVKFYLLEVPFSNFFFSQGAEQADTYFKGQFSRNFSGGINVSLNYNRISQLGQTNQYPHQNVTQQALGTGLWWKSSGGKYDGFLYFASNTTEQQDNGGVAQEPIIGGEFSSPASATVFLREANTRYAHRHIGYQQHYKLFGETTERPDKRALTVSHDARFSSSTYKFADPAPDSTYYQNLFVDERGLRMFMRTQSVQNALDISTFRLVQNDTLKVAQQRDLLRVGLVHQVNWVDQEAADTTINNLFLTGRWNFQPGDRLKLNTYAHLGLWNNAGDYRLSGDLFVDLRPAGQLRIQGINQLYSPTLQETRFYVSQRKIWDNDFSQTLSTSLAATYGLPKLGFSATGRYQLLNNYVYYDEQAIPRQIGEPVSILQLIVEQNFKLGWFHLDNILTLQNISEEVIQLPEFYSKHSLYVQGILFNNVLEFQLGVDVRLNADYFPYYYQPLVGQFILQNQQRQEFFPFLDAYASIKVDQFRFFVRGENLNNLLTGEFYYPIAFYPQQIFYLRFGLGWRFIN